MNIEDFAQCQRDPLLSELFGLSCGLRRGYHGVFRDAHFDFFQKRGFAVVQDASPAADPPITVIFPKFVPDHTRDIYKSLFCRKATFHVGNTKDLETFTRHFQSQGFAAQWHPWYEDGREMVGVMYVSCLDFDFVGGPNIQKFCDETAITKKYKKIYSVLDDARLLPRDVISLVMLYVGRKRNVWLAEKWFPNPELYK